MSKNYLKFLIAILLFSIICNQTTTTQTSQNPPITATYSDPNQTQINSNNNNTNNNLSSGNKSTNVYNSAQAPSESLNDITNPEFKTNIYPVVSKFPVDEQNVIANCFKTNTDSTRYIDPDCYKNSLSSLKSAVGKAFGENLTDYSKQLRGGIACFSVMSHIFGSTSDPTNDQIQTNVLSIISQQANLNQCSAKFIKSYLELLNLRKRYLLTTKENFAQAALKDTTTAETNSFVFTDTEKTEFVSSFKAYCLCLYKFFNNLNTDVSSTQKLVGSLEKCKVTQTNNNINNNNSTSTLNPNTNSTQSTESKTPSLRRLQVTSGTASGSDNLSAPKCCTAALPYNCFACNGQGYFCCSALYTRADCSKCENFDYNSGKFLNSASSATGTAATFSTNPVTNITPPSSGPIAPTPAISPAPSASSTSSQCCLTTVVTGACLICNAAKQPCCTTTYNGSDCVKCELNIAIPTPGIKPLPTATSTNNGTTTQTAVNPTTLVTSGPVTGPVPTGFIGTGTATSPGIIPSPVPSPYICCDANKSIPNCVDCGTAAQPIYPTLTCCVKDKLIENCYGCNSSGNVDFSKCCSDTNQSADCLKCPVAVAVPISATTQPCCDANVKTNCVECPTIAPNAQGNSNENSNLPCCPMTFMSSTSCKKCENTNLIPQKLPECTQQNIIFGPCMPKLTSEISQTILDNIQKNMNVMNNALNSSSVGMAVFVIPDDVLKSAAEIKDILNSKASEIPDFNILKSKLNIDLTSTSDFMPKNALHRLVLDVVKAQNSVDLKKEFEKPLLKTKCDADYIFWCTEGQCKCSGSGCPKDSQTPVTLVNINNSTLNQSVNTGNKLNRILQDSPATSSPNLNSNAAGAQTASQAKDNSNNNNNNGTNKIANTNNQIPILNSGSSIDSLNSYFLCSSCVNSRRVLFSEASFAITGKYIDFYDSASQSNISTQYVQAQTVCNTIFAAGTKEEKSKCRGQMNDKCSDSLDYVCSETRLYNILISNPPTTSAYPWDCDESNINYTEEKCLSWINNKLLIDTIGLNIKAVINLPYLIQASQKNSEPSSNGNLRYLQNTANVKVVSQDPVAADSKAIISVSLAALNDQEVTIDSATATQVPNTSVYVQEVNQVVWSFSSAEGLSAFKNVIGLFVALAFAILI